VDAPKTSPFGAAPTFPSQLFSFPGIAGSHSDPGAPGSPATAPTVPATQPDSLPAVPTQPSLPNYLATDVEPQTAISAEPRLESLEFRPELVPNIGLAKRLFDPHVIKRDFPILQEQVHGRPLIWLDNAATTQKPNAVIDRIASFYQHENSNIHRAAHTLAARATDAYEGAREKVRRFLNASSTREIIFVRGATEGINLIAKSWGHRNVQKDDEIVITWLEHHANIVPWQQLAAEKGARLRVAPVDDTGQVILEEYEKLLGPRTRIVSFSQVSNALGTITPAKQIIEIAHRHGALVMVDAAQSVAHMTTDVQALDCDLLVFSGHKIFAPTGVGVVFGKGDLLETTPPWQGGGNMIIDVTFEKTVYNVSPARFEAGTGTIADAVGLGAALDYLDEIGLENISSYEHELVEYGTAALLTVPGLRLIGTAREKAGVLSFVLGSIPSEEVGKWLDQEGIAVRAGHHCAQPILRRFGVEKTVRPSLALYNTREDIDALVRALWNLTQGRSSS
jgi:cysteine desulfurase/selenocysteine lyase